MSSEDLFFYMFIQFVILNFDFEIVHQWNVICNSRHSGAAQEIVTKQFFSDAQLSLFWLFVVQKYVRIIMNFSRCFFFLQGRLFNHEFQTIRSFGINFPKSLIIRCRHVIFQNLKDDLWWIFSQEGGLF